MSENLTLLHSAIGLKQFPGLCKPLKFMEDMIVSTQNYTVIFFLQYEILCCYVCANVK